MIRTRRYRPSSGPSRKLRALRLAFSDVRAQVWDLPNVLGIGLGFKKSGGVVDYTQPCYVVHVSQKHDVADVERVKETIYGMPTDVQLLEYPEEASSFNGGGQLRSVGETAEGRLGVLVQRADGRIAALTAAHVVFPRTFPVNVAGSGEVVEAHGLTNSWLDIGTVAAARYNRGADVALIDITNSDFDRSVGGGGLVPSDPRVLTDADQGTLPAQLAIDVVGALPNGWLSKRLYTGKFLTRAAGERTFEALCEFRLDNAVAGAPAERGFSGGLICDAVGAPLALLSFAGRVDGEAVAFGWPIAPLYSEWSLRCI